MLGIPALIMEWNASEMRKSLHFVPAPLKKIIY